MNKKKIIIIAAAAVIVLVLVIVGITRCTGNKPNKTEDDTRTTDVVMNNQENGSEERETESAKETEESTTGAGDETESQEPSSEPPTDEEVTTSYQEESATQKEPDKEITTEPDNEKETSKPTESESIADEDAEESFKEAGGTYKDNSDGTVSITGGDVEGELIIPATIDGKSVVLTENAFAIMGQGNDSITSVTINAQVIGACAFQNCSSLKTVIIGENVQEIGNGAFANCPLLETVIFKGEKITELPEYVFMGCPKMTSITLPASITKVHVGFITSYQPYVLEKYPNGPVGEPDYESIVPEFTLYTYSKPGDVTVWSNLYGAEYTEYDGLEAIGTETRKANFKVEYLK